MLAIAASQVASRFVRDASLPPADATAYLENHCPSETRLRAQPHSIGNLTNSQRYCPVIIQMW